ncbi:uncharacterized protein LOC134253852 [Saccostrea cucullata]|uniref:uncharacterized protein LOC134253852 n=1 Tax=Saccostrea cuccullata TaxID=36930 RepID=UPI002ED46D12
MNSGSRREGFRLPTSDVDLMVWPTDFKVICDISQKGIYHIPRHIVFLMECDDLPSGFVRLKVLSPIKDADLRRGCLVINNTIYMSSALLRNICVRCLQNAHIPPISNCMSHGPSCTVFTANDEVINKETDIVFCLQSHHWPPIALQWVQRSREKGWPSESLVSEILNGGFHVVPIGSTPADELEWRISFSRAEQKIVYSMNHCQFLCYGLFKIFLKEVINFQNNTHVLCSYFIKTSVFWIIQSKMSLAWIPENLLSCFWECFKLLIFFVHTGECPNFFIPDNNMFRLKVTGSVQTSLFSHLYNLYCEGISCLLLSPTFSNYLCKVILNRTLRVCIDESSIISTIQLDISLLNELYSFTLRQIYITDFALNMKRIEEMLRGRLTLYQTVSLQCITSRLLRCAALLVQGNCNSNNFRNKVYYKYKNASFLLKLSAKFGFMSDILYLAMYFYRTFRYEQSLRCLQKAQERISVSFILSECHVNPDMYRHCVMGMSLFHKVRKTVVKNITLENFFTYINELVLEQNISGKKGHLALQIPPLVMIHMLFILNHHRLGDTVRSQQSLQDLQTLLLYDDGIYVHPYLRDISWQILGICQQICGDCFRALESYQYSLKQRPYHKIHQATRLRINTLVNEEI